MTERRSTGARRDVEIHAPRVSFNLVATQTNKTQLHRVATPKDIAERIAIEVSLRMKTS